MNIIIVGAGIFGLTFAREASAQLGAKCVVIEKRNHIGGNAYSETERETGIEVHKYGAHLFHTSNERVWQYVNQFSEFTNYQHKVYTTHNGEVFPMPINLGTINQFFRANYTPQEAKELIAEQASAIHNEPSNLAEKGVSLIGQPLFDAFIKNYTAKQWQIPAEELSASIIERLPVRYNYDNRYFNNAYEGLPKDGYATLFQNMITKTDKNEGSIEVRLNTDFFTERQALEAEFPNATIVYTGPIDRYFNYAYGKLQWRSLDLALKIEDIEDFQGCPVMNYADLSEPYTRILEFKHFHPERKYKTQKTAIVYEHSKTWQEGDEPYYPVNTAEDREIYAKYKAKADQELAKNVIFGGRLGEYAYYDMDNTFLSALQAFDKFKLSIT